MVNNLQPWRSPFFKLMAAIVLGLVTTGLALAWPAVAQSVSPPDILQVEVVSSQDAFFYSPPLTQQGGDVYFNNQIGEGAGQIITVTVTVSDDNPTNFSGGPAFGITPTTNISTPYVTTSTWSLTYTIRAIDGSENGVVFTITDLNNLTDTIILTFTQDITDPPVSFVDVTNPHFDSGGGELDSDGSNWYRTSALDSGWAFTAAITEVGAGYASGRADWDHQSYQDDDRSSLPFFDSPGTLTGAFTGVQTNTDGLVAVSLVVTDRVGNSSSAPAITLNLDGTPSLISSPVILENSEYLHAIGDTSLYYGNNMSSAVPFTVTGQAADNGVGLSRATFSPAFGDTPPDDGDPSIWTALYTVESTNTVNGEITVSVYDRVSNVATQTFVYTRDIARPTIPLNFLHIPDADSSDDGFAPDTNGNYEDDPDINVSWSASSDAGSGVAGYYLDTQLPPTSLPLLTGTTGTVTVGVDEDYYLYLVAVDNVGNLSFENTLDTVRVRRTGPSQGRLSITEISGGQYLYIEPSTQITTGTLFYNNTANSSFRVVAAPPASWGDGVFGWKVAFSPGWGEPGMNEVFYPSSEYPHTYSITPLLEATEVFTVYYVNRAGNVLAIPIDAELDTSGPTITFTNITTPTWEINGANWYRTDALGGNWQFSTDVISEQAGVAPPVGWAYWDHSAGSDYDQSQSAPGGDGTFSGVGSNPDGAVTVTVVLTDQVNNPGNISMMLNLDGTPPVITPTGWIESSPYLHVVGNRLFFSQVISDDRSATLRGFAADTGGGSGLDRAVFSPESNLAGSPLPDPSPSLWEGSYTFASDSSQGDGLADVTVYDNVGNSAAAAFTYTLDISAPNGALLNVTNPGYDPDGDELNDSGNWYRSSNLNDGPGSDGWNFFFSFNDAGAGMRSVRADWNHSVDGNDQLNYNPGLDGQGVFGTPVQGGSSGAAVNDDADGVVTVTLGLEDQVGNWGYDSLILRIDNTPPVITGGSWSESSEFLHAEGSTLYFSHQMATPQSATLSGQASDGDGSGLGVMTFSPEPDLAGSPSPDGTPADWSGTYVFNSSSQGDGTAVITLTDHLAYYATQPYTYVLDTIPPTSPGAVTINTPPVVGNYYNTRSLDLGWLASTDNITGSGLLGYYLGTSSPPTEPYPPSATGAVFDVGGDGTFTLYLAARDRVRNSTVAGTAPITIDTVGPAPSITASPEEANRRFLVEWGADDATTWPVAFDVEYQADDGAWIPWLTATGATSQYFGPDTPVEVVTDSSYKFRVRARDFVNNQGDWAESGKVVLTHSFIYLPLVVRAYDASIPFAVFDGFETGTFAGWKTSGALPASIVTSPLPPGGGTYAALLGSPGYGCGDSSTVPIGQASIQAYAYVPGSGTPYLRFDYRVRSYDTVRSSAGEWWDRLEVRVNDDVLARYGDPDPGNLSCSNLYDTGWKQAEFNLSSYKNSTVLLTFFNENHKDRFWNTYSYLDNIRIEVGP